MFFKYINMSNLSKLVKQTVKSYLGISFFGGASVATGTLPIALTEALYAFNDEDIPMTSKAKTEAGILANRMEIAGKVLIKTVSYGFFIGAAPITYPCLKFYESCNKKGDSTQKEITLSDTTQLTNIN